MKIPDNYVLVCPECQGECLEGHNSFGCNRCQRLWPKGAGHEQYRVRKEKKVVDRKPKPV
jgi:hypothetical protein